MQAVTVHINSNEITSFIVGVGVGEAVQAVEVVHLAGVFLRIVIVVVGLNIGWGSSSGRSIGAARGEGNPRN